MKWRLLTPTNSSSSTSGSIMDSASAAEVAEDRAGSGKIGNLRRAFCLLVLFDLIFTCILWIFYMRYFNLDLSMAFDSQVKNYNFRSSVFDLVAISLLRFILLEMFYALFRIRNPWIVAVTTASSTAFVIVKIILYDYTSVSQGHSVFDYLLPIMTLLLVWVETLFLDCKVLPVERADLQLSQSYSERSPLLGHQPPHSYGQPSYVPSEGFVTPDSTPEHSDDEGAATTEQGYLPPSNLPMPKQEERVQFGQRATRLAEEAWQSYEDPDWHCSLDRPMLRILYQNSRHRSSGKAWRLEVLVGLSAERMFQELWDRVERQPEWNPTVLFSRVVCRLDRSVAIVHNATAEAGGGLIKSRDFVTLCVRQFRNGIHYTGGVSVETALVPRSDKYTRGENYPGGIACVPHGAAACRVVWIVDSDIKGWMPIKVVDQAMTGVLTELGHSMHQHASRIAQREGPAVGASAAAPTV